MIQKDPVEPDEVSILTFNNSAWDEVQKHKKIAGVPYKTPDLTTRYVWNG